MDLDRIDPELRDVHELAVALARRAGEIQLNRYETKLQVYTKSASIDIRWSAFSAADWKVEDTWIAACACSSAST